MYEDVYLVDDNLSLVTLTALNAIEDTLGLTLPSGYKALLTTLGEGTYCFFVRTVSPTEIVARTEELRSNVEDAKLLEKRQLRSLRKGHGFSNCDRG